MAERPTSERDGERNGAGGGEPDIGERDIRGPEIREGDIVERHLARAWQAVAPTPDLSQRVRARLTSSTAATAGAVGLGVASNVRPESTWASVQATGKLGALLGAGLLGAGLLAGYFIRDAQEETPAPAALVAPASAMSATAASDPMAPMAPTPEPRATAEPVPLGETSPAALSNVALSEAAPTTPRAGPSRAARVHAPKQAQSPTAASSASPTSATDAPHPGDELALLRRAERAVRADDSALALALIGELEARYPDSRLLEERRALELMAYCGAGSTDARSRAERFLREHPESVYAGRIREACPIEESSSPRAPR